MNIKITVKNRQRAIKVDLPWLQSIARHGLAEICANWLDKNAPLAGLEKIEATIIDDAAIAEVHGQFFGDPTPTDVITFDYGEILTCAGIAHANAARYRTTADREIALYIIHGLLHLNGYKDKSPAAAKKMRIAQEKVLARCTRRVAKSVGSA